MNDVGSMENYKKPDESGSGYNLIHEVSHDVPGAHVIHPWATPLSAGVQGGARSKYNDLQTTTLCPIHFTNYTVM